MSRGRSTDADRSSKGGNALALIPVTVALVGASLLFPRAAAPEAVPLPAVDARAVRRSVEEDRGRAERTLRAPLPGDVRELGSAIRELNRREATGADLPAITLARNEIDRALPRVLAEHGASALLDLRAAQLASFLAAVRAWEEAGASAVAPEAGPAAQATGGDELTEVAGSFVPRLAEVGWCDAVAHRCLLDDDERRVAFKLTWNGVAGVAGRPEMAPTLDEMRVLYTFYLTHPHPPEQQKAFLAASRNAARASQDPAACAAATARENAAAEAWRLDKVNKLGALDATYPLVFARGVVQYRMGSYDASAQSFQAWLDAHPDGPLTLRAKNHLKAALEASR